jgi:prepilin signal peptidase PulO-like enzyme (type II secretory pathway)
MKETPMPEPIRSVSRSTAALAVVWLSTLLAVLMAPVARLVARTKRDEAGQEAITIAVAVLFGILLIAFTYPLWKGVVQAIVDKVTNQVNSAS